MRQPIPIACSLSPGQRLDREAEFRDLAITGLLARERTESGIRLRFEPSEETRARVLELVSKEKDCCPFFDFALEADAGELLLDVSAPAEAQPVLDAFFESFSPGVEVR
jgi:hypothetical protein